MSARLLEIRREAELAWRSGAGVLLPGELAIPQATPETGYYGVPLLKPPQWKWEIPVYFFRCARLFTSPALQGWVGNKSNQPASAGLSAERNRALLD